MRLPRPSRLRTMFWHDRLWHLFWRDKWGKTVTGMWGVAWTEWIAIAFLWLLVWRHQHIVLHPGPHRPGMAVAAALLPVLGVVANRRRADERMPPDIRTGRATRSRAPGGAACSHRPPGAFACPSIRTRLVVRSAPSEVRRCPRT
jgi:hypothetical protein